MRIIFEKGLQLHRNKAGLWSFVPSHDTQLEMSPSKISQEYDVRPVLLAERHPSGKELRTLYSPLGTPSANPFALLEIDPHGSMMLPFRSLRYVLGAAYYHCGQLAQKYSETWCAFHSHALQSNGQSDIVNFAQYGFQEERYYEFDALVTSVFRCYETMRFVVWHAFGAKEGRSSAGPRKNFEKTLNACEGLPSSLESRLSQSWCLFGAKAKDYRDCIQHYFPLDRGFALARMERLKGDVWSALMLIPDNPQDKSPGEFAYNSQTDMLTYGWELTNEILEVTELTVKEVVDTQNRRYSNGPRAR